MSMQAFLAMVDAIEFGEFENAYIEVDGVVTGTFADGKQSN